MSTVNAANVCSRPKTTETLVRATEVRALTFGSCRWGLRASCPIAAGKFGRVRFCALLERPSLAAASIGRALRASLFSLQKKSNERPSNVGWPEAHAALFLHDRVHLPIFLRAEREMAEMEAELAAVEWAKAILRLDEDECPDSSGT